MPNDDIVINKINIIGRCIKQLVTAAMNADRRLKPSGYKTQGRCPVCGMKYSAQD